MVDLEKHDVLWTGCPGRKDGTMSAKKAAARFSRNKDMTREEVEKGLQWLSAKFGIPGGVKLVWKERMRSGRSCAGPDATVVMGPMAFCGTRDMMLHEFAHILDLTRHAKTYSHDDEYATCLLEVVKASMDSREYRWATEFQSVRTLAVREGLLNKSVLRKAMSQCL